MLKTPICIPTLFLASFNAVKMEHFAQEFKLLFYDCISSNSSFNADKKKAFKILGRLFAMKRSFFCSFFVLHLGYLIELNYELPLTRILQLKASAKLHFLPFFQKDYFFCFLSYAMASTAEIFSSSNRLDIVQ